MIYRGWIEGREEEMGGWLTERKRGEKEEKDKKRAVWFQKLTSHSSR
jgi:hypothetical protein